MAAIPGSITKADADLGEARQVAARFATEVRRLHGDRVKRVCLFGSAARGDWTDDSDVDVMVLLSAMRTREADEVSAAAFHIGTVMSGVLLRPLMMTPEQFDRLLAQERRLAADIQREGIEL